jgi:sulfur carrier protein
MRIRLNGEEREVAAGVTVGALLNELGLRRDGIAVAINLQVVPRGEHDQRALVEGDKIEVLQAVGGG